MVDCTAPEVILEPLIGSVCEEYHRANIKSHNYSALRCKAHVLPGQPEDTERTRGDMNIVYKVRISMECPSSETIIPVVLKCAPHKVLVSDALG